MSPSDEHVAPEPVHRLPWQLPEQQAPFVAQMLPRVVQPPPTIAAHLPATQLLPQHSPSAAQACVFDLHTAVLHFPPTQAPLQHAVEIVHAAPAAVQAPRLIAQVFDTRSHLPAQQPLSARHDWPGPPQLTGTGGGPPAAPVVPAP